MSKRSKSIFFAVLFTVIEALIIFGLFKNKGGKYAGNVAFTTVLFIIFTFLEIKFKLYISTYSRIILIITAIGHTLCGQYLGFYEKSKYFDKGLHLFGTYAVTYFAYSFLNLITRKQIVSRFREFIFIVCIGMSLGALFETCEFFIDVIAHPKPASQSGLVDTNLDLIFNYFGAILAGIHLFLLDFRVGNR
ncbi:hypothetical protein Curi_c24960 [Gottschalkia acidurici 9a]|uniref:DUF2238 domain-containing protein n=1 Tax=Gottschalkia acidurici (strain ATCC 7906 / DSM 604 / BCRC 14475 / CIP 104303 / KCTC 5404 / NCIMB 10678 / 9a) TaxID=1128398 RepID=K0B4L4_GOTA9|nr:hypothetical protein [Gottschalkia acidurici]AFS79491.1 hypothetical protein Curi_c24960 [Gottschalkia acidurici 9a]